MTELDLVLLSLLLTAIAVFSFILAMRAKREHTALKAIANYQRDLAKLAYVVTHDSEVNNATKEYVNTLADHAFDFELFKAIRKKHKNDRANKVTKVTTKELNQTLKEHFGKDWSIAKQAASIFADIILISGHEYIPDDRQERERRFRSDRKSEMAKSIEIDNYLRVAA
jgi:hypothetical protein